MNVELAIIGGTVVDPDSGSTYLADIGISDGKIVAIDRSRAGTLDSAEKVDATGRFVLPGIVDSHVHVYEHVMPSSLNADAIGIRQGVCAVIDAGSFGPGNAAGFGAYIVKPSTTHVYGLVNISRNGVSGSPGEGEVLGFLNPNQVARTLAKFPAWAVGVKARASVTAAGLLGIMSTQLSKQAARESGVPLMVHIGNAPPTLDDVANLLTAGDLMTHCFHGKIGGMITRQGAVLPAVAAAIDRGVLLDVGHGSGSFAWDTAEKALALRTPPHIISTDLHTGCINGPAYSMVKTMSKFLHLGMSLVDVARASSTAPANAFGLGDKYGRVAVGFPANLSIVEHVNRTETMWDVEKQSRVVTGVLEARHAILDGVVHTADPDATVGRL